MTEDRVALLDALSGAVLCFDSADLSLTYANQRAREWISVSLGQNIALHQPFSAVFPAADERRLWRRISRGRTASFTLEISTDGRSFPVKFTLKPIPNGELLVEGRDESVIRETEAMLRSYSELIELKNQSIKQEQRRVERLLFNVLPEKSIMQLRRFGHTIPERFDEVSVLFLDFVGFTQLSQEMSTEELFSELNDLFTSFDQIITEHRCERIKTIGDAYLAVCGMPEKIEDHAGLIACAALKMRDYIISRNQRTGRQWRCRVGIHTGEVTGGVVGKLKYIYDIFGDGVNTASRMESYSEPMKINISPATRALLGPAYQIRSRGAIEVKGKGEMEMFFLEGTLGEPCSDRLLKDLDFFQPEDSLF